MRSVGRARKAEASEQGGGDDGLRYRMEFEFFLGRREGASCTGRQASERGRQGWRILSTGLCGSFSVNSQFHGQIVIEGRKVQFSLVELRAE